MKKGRTYRMTSTRTTTFYLRAEKTVKPSLQTVTVTQNEVLSFTAVEDMSWVLTPSLKTDVFTVTIWDDYGIVSQFESSIINNEKIYRSL